MYGTILGSEEKNFSVKQVQNGFVVTLNEEKEIENEMAPYIQAGIQMVSPPGDIMDKIRENTGPELPKRKVFQPVQYIFPTIEQVISKLKSYFENDTN